MHTMHLTGRQITARDKMVDAKTQQMEQHSMSEKEVHKYHMNQGSKGASEFQRAALSYFEPLLFSPIAVYHSTYLGPGKDFLRWLLVRMHATDRPKEGKLVLPFARPRDTKLLLQARRGHVVPRSKPDCIFVDFTQHLGMMSISETQVMWEVAIPYLLHDLHHFGVPQEVLVMALLLRYGMMCFTRQLGFTTQEYSRQLKDGTAACFAFGALAEYLHRQEEGGISQFSFTWKLHALQHLEAQCRARGFTIFGNDLWVERLMRELASRIVKYVLDYIRYLHVHALLVATCVPCLELKPHTFTQSMTHVQGQGHTVC